MNKYLLQQVHAFQIIDAIFIRIKIIKMNQVWNKHVMSAVGTLCNLDENSGTLKRNYDPEMTKTVEMNFLSFSTKYFSSLEAIPMKVKSRTQEQLN